MTKAQAEEIVRAITGNAYWDYDSKAEALKERIIRLTHMDAEDPFVLLLLIHHVQYAGYSGDLNEIIKSLKELSREFEKRLDSMYDCFSGDSYLINQALVDAHLRAHGIAWGIVFLSCAVAVSVFAVAASYLFIRSGFLKL